MTAVDYLCCLGDLIESEIFGEAESLVKTVIEDEEPPWSSPSARSDGHH